MRLPKHKPRTLRDLHDMCGKHNALDCYLWLAHRFPETFPESDAAMAQKRRCIGLVAAGLASRRLQLPEKKEADVKKSVAAKLVASKSKKKPSAKKRGRVVRGKKK